MELFSEDSKNASATYMYKFKSPSYKVGIQVLEVTPLTNYVTITYFSINFWLQSNAAKKWQY